MNEQGSAFGRCIHFSLYIHGIGWLRSVYKRFGHFNIYTITLGGFHGGSWVDAIPQSLKKNPLKNQLNDNVRDVLTY